MHINFGESLESGPHCESTPVHLRLTPGRLQWHKLDVLAIRSRRRLRCDQRSYVRRGSQMPPYSDRDCSAGSQCLGHRPERAIAPQHWRVWRQLARVADDASAASLLRE